MRKAAAIVLILLISSQAFGQLAILALFKIQQAWIAKNTCENRFRPQLHCNGNCVLMKKLRQQEKEEKNEPCQLKMESATVVLSSRSFFAAAPPAISISKTVHAVPCNSGTPVDRTFRFFHPPRNN